MLGHHFPVLLEPFLRHAYYEPITSSVYFHAIVDALIPNDGEAICEEVHQYDDAIFSQVSTASRRRSGVMRNSL